MIRKLSGLFGSPVFKGAVAIGCAGLAVKLLSDTIAELRVHVDELSAAAHERAQYLAQLQREIRAAEQVREAQGAKRAYPSREDLAPLVEPAGEGEAVELELQRP